MKLTQNNTESRRHRILHTLILLLCAMIWGFAFVSQSVGAEYVDAFTFLAGRSWIAVIFLLPVIAAADRIRRRKGLPAGGLPTRARRNLYLLGGVSCGTALFLASAAQQIGISYTTTAKAGFITALYVVIVPVISVFLGQAPSRRIWLCVLIGIIGLYFLCMKGGPEEINRGDVLMIICALLFSGQILLVGHFNSMMDGIRLSFLEMLTEAVLATVCIFFFEKPTAGAIRSALPALLYAGVMSSGVAYTLQIIGQEGLDPTIASLTMCLESVFSAIGGFLLLGQTLTLREFLGCTLMFAAIVISQMPERLRVRGG